MSKFFKELHESVLQADKIIRGVSPDDDDNPEWTDEDFKRARPAQEALPELLSKELADKLLAPKKSETMNDEDE